jgi:hypothetical protein
MVCVKMSYDDSVKRVKAATSAEEDHSLHALVLKDPKGAVVGKFKPLDQIESWWIEDNE